VANRLGHAFGDAAMQRAHDTRSVPCGDSERAVFEHELGDACASGLAARLEAELRGHGLEDDRCALPRSMGRRQAAAHRAASRECPRSLVTLAVTVATAVATARDVALVGDHV